jgi:hypothetical protein
MSVIRAKKKGKLHRSYLCGGQICGQTVTPGFGVNQA